MLVPGNTTVPYGYTWKIEIVMPEIVRNTLTKAIFANCMEVPTSGQEEYSLLVTVASILLLLILIQVGLVLLRWGFRFSIAVVDNVATATTVITIIIIIRALIYWDQVGSDAFFDDLRDGIWDVTLANMTLVYDAVYQHPACGLLFIPIPLFLWYRRLHDFTESIGKYDPHGTDEGVNPTVKEQNEDQQELHAPHDNSEESGEILSSTN